MPENVLSAEGDKDGEDILVVHLEEESVIGIAGDLDLPGSLPYNVLVAEVLVLADDYLGGAQAVHQH